MKNRSVARLTFCSILVCMAQHMVVVAEAATIDWEVRNRFRAFDFLVPANGNAALESAQMFEKLAPRSDDRDMQQWATRLISEGGSPYSSRAPGPWDETAGRNERAYARDFTELPQRIALKASLLGAPERTSVCTWRIGTAVVATQSCERPVFIDDVASAGAELSVYQEQVLLDSQVIVPTLRIVLGLGDSYGAGEGSPDRPTLWRSSIADTEWPLGQRRAINVFVERPADWWSNRCNRSFYSYQNMVALRIAADDKRSIVSFVHFACAGAEVVDGLLAPQRMAPGRPHDCPSMRKRQNKNVVDAKCDVPYSQLRAAMNVLCADAPQPLSDQQLSHIASRLRGLKHGRDQLGWINDLAQCSGGKPVIDQLLLSIGGNDMGFGGVVLWGLMPKGGRYFFSDAVVELARKETNAVCPYKGSGGGKCGELSAEDRIEEIPQRYIALRSALDELFTLSPDSVIANQYPNPLRRMGGRGARIAPMACRARSIPTFKVTLLLPTPS